MEIFVFSRAVGARPALLRLVGFRVKQIRKTIPHARHAHAWSNRLREAKLTALLT